MDIQKLRFEAVLFYEYYVFEGQVE